jgi:hypothetical protein
VYQDNCERHREVNGTHLAPAFQVVSCGCVSVSARFDVPGEEKGAAPVQPVLGDNGGI